MTQHPPAFAWDAWALAFLVATFLQFAAAILIYAVGPRRLLNRALALTLFLGAAINLTYALGVMATTFEDGYALAVVAQAGKLAVLPLHLLFIGAALQTPLVRPLRTKGVRVALVAGSLALPFAAVIWPAAFLGPPAPRSPSEFALTPASALVDAVGFGVFLFAFVASVSAYRRARAGSAARERDWWFVLAFGTRDLALAAFIVARGTILAPDSTAYEVAYRIAFPGALSAYVLLLAYGVLKWHLFDLDLVLKGTVRRGVLAGAYVAAFLVVTQLATNGFEARFGWAWGGVAAGLLLFALAPLQRLSQRLANAAMPEVDGSEEYLAHRRAEVYKAALEEILTDEVVTVKERVVLAKLQASLGLRDETAAALERDVRAALDARAPPVPL